MPKRTATCLGVIALILTCLPVLAQEELTYEQYRDLSWAAQRLDHMAMFEPLQGEAGMYVALGDRFSTVQVIRMNGRGAERVWKSNQLGGVPETVLAADLGGDGLDDALICNTGTGKIYVWSLEDYNQLWESLTGEYQQIACFTTANLDEDPAREIVMIADGRLVQIDGATFTKDFTSIDEYSATMIRCGDVDGDGRVEVVLNTGQVIDPISGNLEWEDQNFFSRIELLDIDGDGMPEVITENEVGGPVKVFDVDRRSEVRFQ
ncbi:MAG: hypothetical protein AB7V45_05280 [Candidatus Krumholzibacteriia bacterium]